MRQSDARSLKHQSLSELRRRGVLAVQSGETPSTVACILGVSPSTLYGWLAKYRQGGWDALDARRRGGRPPKLDAAKLKWIYETVTMKSPQQLQFPFALWTSLMMRDALQRQFGITLSKSSVCRLLHQLGLSPQKPLWPAYQRDPVRIQKWLTEDFPAIQDETRKSGAIIMFGDEAGVRSDFHAGTTWAKRGQTPVIATTGARFGLNIMSAVSARGDLRFRIVQGTVNGEVFADFLKSLLTDMDRPVTVIVDGHPSHRSKVASQVVSESAGGLKLYFLPGYSPDLNPDEQVWTDLKNNHLVRMVITGPDQLKDKVVNHLKGLQRHPTRVQSFFRLPDTLYAAS